MLIEGRKMKYIIIGNGVHAKTMYNYISQTKNEEIIGFCVDKNYIGEGCLCGKKVYETNEFLREIKPCDVRLIMGVGYTKMGDVKKSLFERFSTKGYIFDNYIHPTAIVSTDVSMGEGNSILAGAIIGSGSVLGNGNLIFEGALMSHDVMMGDYNTMSVGATVAGKAIINSHCFIGANATVRDNVELEDYVLVGASAYADKNIAKRSVLAGNKSVLLKNKQSDSFI